jgi:hypothetical protein
MNYPNIKQAKLTHRQIAKALGYKNVNSFRCSSAHKRHMQGVEAILELTKSDTYHFTNHDVFSGAGWGRLFGEQERIIDDLKKKIVDPTR